jgi:hypothetical protein
MSDGENEILKDLDSRRLMDLEELDTLAERYFISAFIGNDKAAAIYLKVVERRAKLLGLDTPTKISMEVTTYDVSELNRQYELLQRNTNGQEETDLD